MKTLKFREKLSKLILSGEKRVTWRLFDDKSLAAGDEVSFLIWETGEEFAKARLTEIKETTLGALTEKDWEGQKRFLSDEGMYQHYRKYYHRPVDGDSPVKIIKFELV